jgi:glutamine synthetase
VRRGKGLMDKPLADKIAKVVKMWAIDRGITHFCHWFQPMTGLTAEKHDAFLTLDDNGDPVEKFSGSQLIQSEPDASSFPSGGVRATFEARGYTAWDLSSPMFITEGANGRTLCIPSVFIGYHGHALDEKGPLLRSLHKLNETSLEAMKLLGDTETKRVYATLGVEQEYFLIDKSFAALRPDLQLTGRTLLGARPPKGQELEDHYFGAIPARVTAFMQEVEHELYKLGVPAKTRHNEVAPSQFEIAPMFEESNVAVDHNHLIMEVMRRVAKDHDFALLLHEKPFAGINGSGKHNNWALSTDRGENLLDPGETPHQNLRFLYFLGAVLKGVHRHNGLLRAAIASSGNDHRLGANEAPPAIVSVFLGDELTSVLNKIKLGEESSQSAKAMLHLGLSHVAQIKKDTTDRNRTSPFAFTGNKFEFRAVGSSASCSWPVAVLNGAMSEALLEMNKRFKEKMAKSGDRDKAVLDLVREVVVETEAVRFEGDNYSEKWQREAEARGLDHLKNTPEALKAYNYDHSRQMIEGMGILTPEELNSRVMVLYERYIKKIEIEVEVLKALLDSYVMPAASLFAGDLASAAAKMKSIGASSGPQEERVKKLGKLLDELNRRREDLEGAIKSVHDKGHDDLPGKAKLLASKVLPVMLEARNASDQLETLVSDAYWPLPKYREMLFS